MAGDGDKILEWKPGRIVSLSEFTFKSDTSGGPGGQHANRSATRIALLWNLEDSTAFSDREKERLRKALANRLNAVGRVQLRSSGERSANRNREECLQLLAALIRQALRPRKRRVPTKPSKASKARRVDAKKRRGKIKSGRRKPTGEE